MGKFSRKRKNRADSSKDSQAKKKQPMTEEQKAKAAQYRIQQYKNERFERFYKVNNPCKDETELAEMIEIMKTQLPSTFRINRMTGFADQVKAVLENDVFNFAEIEQKNITLEGIKVTRPTPISWYPGGYGWELPLARRKLRKVPELEKFREWIVVQHEMGVINRQEAVSMVPTLLMDIRPHHRCVDLCAAPGSKTQQIIENLHFDAVTNEHHSLPTGYVMANDANYSRAQMLVHQLKRVESANFCVVNHEGQHLPNVKIGPKPEAGVMADQVQVTKEPFDRVLCDVPCTGDGTSRKNPGVWKTWGPQAAMGLHTIQIRIAMRGLEMLKVGGLMVYSTCSLNPVENEAVVVQILKESAGAVEIVDVSDKLPGLKRIPGMTSWKVFDKQMEEYATFDEVPKNFKRKYVKETVFAPKPEEVAQYNLDRCVRILPHFQNTGGFFVTVFRKTGELLKTTPEGTTTSSSSSSCADASPSPQPEIDSKPEATEQTSQFVDESAVDRDLAGNSRKPRPKSDPFGNVIQHGGQALLDNIADFYGLTKDCPLGNVLFRDVNEDEDSKNKQENSDFGAPMKRLYFMPDVMNQVFSYNERQKLRIVCGGMRAFERFRSGKYVHTCHYRVCQEAGWFVLPFMTKQVVRVGAHDFVRFLQTGKQVVPRIQEKDVEYRRQVAACATGCVMVVLTGPVASALSTKPIVASGWKTDACMTVMVSKVEIKSLLALLSQHVDFKAVEAETAARQQRYEEKKAAHEAAQSPESTS